MGGLGKGEHDSFQQIKQLEVFRLSTILYSPGKSCINYLSSLISCIGELKERAILVGSAFGQNLEQKILM